MEDPQNPHRRRRFRWLALPDAGPEFRRGLRVGALIGLGLVLLLFGYCALTFLRA